MDSPSARVEDLLAKDTPPSKGLVIAVTALRLLWLIPLSFYCAFSLINCGHTVLRLTPHVFRGHIGLLPLVAVNIAFTGVLSWFCARAWKKTVRIMRREAFVSAAALWWGLGGSIVFLVLPVLILVPKIGDLLRYSGDGKNKGNLASVRLALDAHRSVSGAFPDTLVGMTQGQNPIFKELPSLWDTWGAGFLHRKTNQVDILQGREAKDTGHWAYVNNPASPDRGAVFIDCTHTDARGSIWSSY